MSRLNRVIRFEPMDGIIRVQAGIRWHELLRFIQPHGFAVKVMPQFANFSIGGSVASNAHGHYVGIGPMSASIRSLRRGARRRQPGGNQPQRQARPVRRRRRRLRRRRRWWWRSSLN